MRISIQKKIFSTQEIDFILTGLKQAAEHRLIEPRYEDNIYMMASYKGIEKAGISPKWNIKIYQYNPKKRGHSVVCVDNLILGKLIEGDYAYFTPPDLPVLRIDDAGWGFPLCGVMVGVSDEQVVCSAVVPVEYFREDTRHNFKTGRYLKKYAELAIELLKEFQAAPETHRVEICSGYVNQPLKERLRKLHYDVRVVEIKGLLQNQLEVLYKDYVRAEIKADIYYDPKAIKKSDIPRRYRYCVAYGKTHCPEQLKTGWEALSEKSDLEYLLLYGRMKK
jgi:hypothetical protein